MGTVLDLVCGVGAIAQPSDISARTIQNADQLGWFGRAVTASRIVGKGGMGWIQTRVEHGNDDPFALRAGAARRYSRAVPNLIGSYELGTAKGRCVIQTFALD